MVDLRRASGPGFLASLLTTFGCWAQAVETNAGGRQARLVDHGIALPAAEGRGYYALQDKRGRNLAISTPWDLLAPRAYLLVTDIDRRTTTQVYAPEGVKGAVRQSVVASNGRFYTAVNATFLELDPTTLSWTFRGDPPPGVATYLSMEEGPNGVLWAGALDTHLVSFDPKKRELKHYGRMDDQEMYLSYLAFDRAGWVYCGIGVARWDIVAFNPATGEKRRVVPNAQRRPGTCRVQSGADGSAYGCTTPDNWWRLEGGQATRVPAEAVPKAMRFGPEPRRLPDGREVAGFYLLHRYLKVHVPGQESLWIPFDYECCGADIAVLAAGPDGKVYGSGAHPSHLFRYDPETDDLVFFPDERLAFKSLAVQGTCLFGGTYSGGYFWVLDTARPCDLKPYPSRRAPGTPPGPPPSGRAVTDNPNPWLIGQYNPNVNIPRAAFAHPDGKHILIAGQPGYGYVGGGLILHNLENRETIALTHQDLIPNHSTMAMQALPNGDLLCGTTPKGGHGTNPLDRNALLYILDWHTKKVKWRGVPVEGLYGIRAMQTGPDGLYYCVGHRTDGEVLLVVFNAAHQQVVSTKSLAPHGTLTANAALALGPDENLYLVLSRAVLRIHPATLQVEKLADAPGGRNSAGIAILGGRLYFGAGSHLWSLAL